MEKYGFIYIWQDRKRKMWYIGRHWGTEDDGYICSSPRMRATYRRRPTDFKRRIIERVESRSQLAEAEHRWLQMIPDEELGVRYYNLSNNQPGHWTDDPQRNDRVKDKIKARHHGKRWITNGLESKMLFLGDEMPDGWAYGYHRKNTKEERQKQSDAQRGRSFSEEHRANIGKANRGKTRTPEHRAKISRSNMGRPGTMTGRKHTPEARAKMRRPREKKHVEST